MHFRPVFSYVAVVKTHIFKNLVIFIPHFFFLIQNFLLSIATQTDCRQKCQDHTECRFWYWYPIDYSPAPLYCYLYRSCEGGADEQVSDRFTFYNMPIYANSANFQTVGLVLGGRHPGFYFLAEDESLDLVCIEVETQLRFVTKCDFLNGLFSYSLFKISFL